jgi:hypothetical protein
MKVPSYIVKATVPEDVQKAVRWAAEKNVRVVIKTTGHDFLGRNVGYGALSKASGDQSLELLKYSEIEHFPVIQAIRMK